MLKETEEAVDFVLIFLSLRALIEGGGAVAPLATPIRVIPYSSIDRLGGTIFKVFKVVTLELTSKKRPKSLA